MGPAPRRLLQEYNESDVSLLFLSVLLFLAIILRLLKLFHFRYRTGRACTAPPERRGAQQEFIPLSISPGSPLKRHRRLPRLVSLDTNCITFMSEFGRSPKIGGTFMRRRFLRCRAPFSTALAAVAHWMEAALNCRSSRGPKFPLARSRDPGSRRYYHCIQSAIYI